MTLLPSRLFSIGLAAMLMAQAPANPFHFDHAPEQGVLTRGQVPADTQRLMVDGHAVRFAPDGRFPIGFGRDHPATTTINATRKDGSVEGVTLPVAKHLWRISSLPGLAKHGQPNGVFEARRPAELAQINTARQINSDAQGWRQHFIWPTHGRLSDPFGAQRIYAGQPGAFHAGLDIAVPSGTHIVAPADGVVTLAADQAFTLEGHLLMLDHGLGVNSAFLHLSRIMVHVGDHVKQGQLIGLSGQSGRATGPHLHWAIRWNDEKVDPLSLLR